jgi:hypothetical protein
MHYLIYCDESEGKGRFFSNFYGGALIEASRREGIETLLMQAKSAKLQGELKWTKISEYNEAEYIQFIDRFFDLVQDGFIKMRVMFTQNINRIDHVDDYDPDEKYFKLYYQFVKHAFGLRFCNPGSKQAISASVFIDNAPDTKAKLENFKSHLSSLSEFPIFKKARVRIEMDAIMEIQSHEHILLQAVDIVLGSIQFRLNERHLDIPAGMTRRGKRTRAKERVYRHIHRRICLIYPRFNIGVSTGQAEGNHVRWRHQYRHWCFVPKQSLKDLSFAKRQKKQAPQTPT